MASWYEIENVWLHINYISYQCCYIAARAIV